MEMKDLNGCYGLIKGQDLATADKGSRTKKRHTVVLESIDLCELAIQSGWSRFYGALIFR